MGDTITSGDMHVVDVTSGGVHTGSITSAEVQSADNVTSGEVLSTDISSGEMPVSVGEAIDNSQGSEAETTGGEDNSAGESPEIQSSDMYSEVQATDSPRFVEAETSENEGVSGTEQTTDNMCSEAQSTDNTDPEESAQFVDSPCSEVSGSDEQSSYLQAPEVLPTAEADIIPDPVSQSDENVVNVTYKEDAGEASQSSSVSLQLPRSQEMEGEASQSSSVELPAASDQTTYPTGSSLDEPSQSYSEDMEVEESLVHNPNQKSPDDDVSSSETVNNTDAVSDTENVTLAPVGRGEDDQMVVDATGDHAESGTKEADSTDNQQPMEET